MQYSSITGKCLSLRYEEGDFGIEQRIKNGYSGSYFQKGYYKKASGYGFATCIKPSRLILTSQINGCIHEVWIDGYFKDSIGRLTSKRITALNSTIPKEMNFYECESNSGRIYYVANEDDLNSWRISANL